MVACTLPFKLEHELPSIPPEKMEPKQTPADQLKHAKEQIALTQQYPGRPPQREYSQDP
jgi:hypothetical protein